MLKDAIPLERAQMRLKVVISGKEARKVREKLVKLASKVECEDWESGTLNLVCMGTGVLIFYVLCLTTHSNCLHLSCRSVS